jgi:hypothetical protein
LVHLEDRVGADGARRLLAAEGRLDRIWRAAARRNGRDPSATQLELVRLPVAVAEASTASSEASSASPQALSGSDPVRGRARGRRVARVPVPRLFVVDRVLGHGWAVAYESNDVPSAAPDEGAVLPARLAVSDCVRPLEALSSRAAFAFGRGRGPVAALGPARAASYPFWLRYRRSRSGRIAFVALDAVTGQRPGSALRAALAAALVDVEAE